MIQNSDLIEALNKAQIQASPPDYFKNLIWGSLGRRCSSMENPG
jgi:hypothetical protein